MAMMMSDARTSNGAGWTTGSNEVVLREDRVDRVGQFAAQRRRDALRLIVPTLGFGAMAVVWVAFFAADMSVMGVSWLPGVAGSLSAACAVALALTLVKRPNTTSLVERYVFTSQRILALDSGGSVVGQIGETEFDTAERLDDRVVLLCPDDQSGERAFVISEIDGLDDVHEFVTATYKGVSP
ncbi:hypothetical protein Mmar10_0568 [Maricaulis maris MCS10]|uniref:Uncharacterized protein n=2 Tax=Maricaulis TaxID=74317 RepID=Q0AS76_MARMM|nr:hypothetical protein [Maricaulis maris]ABI64861.1 hypothetical protein Mmar10_0568 [Maricaulis maris MCS10]